MGWKLQSCNLKSITAGLSKKNEGYEVLDLYNDNFNPVYSAKELQQFSKGQTPYNLVREYQKKLKQASELVFIFPIWWYDVPAILKGFLDKVFLPQFAYTEDEEGNWEGLLKHIQKVTLVTTATYSKEALTKNGDAIQGVFMNSTLRGVGIEKMI
ncbi:NAD(P)H-dependent oxidoreductase [Lactococcus lactis]|uniref:NAD(P)H-dependent oxidoreductase n=1 Tax=Lactococcus lactis TaxID=1358 RepID=UPI002417126E|nr:NAD(P)H-dependent oxidoreductase [Lactococcus lactis]MDG4969513.1 NAD(P)H-dependent oxidoreductase [Lactococcus lactis]MDG5102738.1 NAD(P)H-dependent oxidoreductase [Lactococcus lactis]